jgi:hypothetical protein
VVIEADQVEEELPDVCHPSGQQSRDPVELISPLIPQTDVHDRWGKYFNKKWDEKSGRPSPMFAAE